MGKKESALKSAESCVLGEIMIIILFGSQNHFLWPGYNNKNSYNNNNYYNYNSYHLRFGSLEAEPDTRIPVGVPY